MRRVSARLIPFFGLCFFLASLDRLNISIAALTMNDALGLSAKSFGLGVGAFYVSYVLFAVPSNIALSRLGARRWLAVLLIGWGAVSATMAAVTGVAGLVAVRVALGAAEAGLFPGVVFLSLRWFPSAYRARFMALFVACGVAAAAIGPSISVQLLQLEGALGIRGWQWLFILEGLPAVALGLLSLVLLENGPAEASWLSPGERDWLLAALEAERLSAPPEEDPSIGRGILTLPIVWMLVLSAGIEIGASGLGYWLPTVLKSMSFRDADIGNLVSGLGLSGMVGMYLWSRRSDRRRERLWHLALPMVLGGLGLAMGGVLLNDTSVAIIALGLAIIGVTSAAPILWSLPGNYLTPRAAPIGIAVINSAGNIASIVSPVAVGALRDATGDFRSAMIASGLPMIMAVLCIPLLGTARSKLGAIVPPASHRKRQ